jgi:4-alpha-glucanotransferase
MNDAAVRELAGKAGIAVAWRDFANGRHQVSIAALRRILAALNLPCETADELADSRCRLDAMARRPLITANVGEPIELPVARTVPSRLRLTCEDGAVVELRPDFGPRGPRLRGIDTPGYHRLELGDGCTTLAVAPSRCHTVAEMASGGRVWGLAAQAYGLRSAGDFGIGDMAGIVALAEQAAALKADVLALSPMHAGFAADPSHFSPYSPSTRLFYNPLYADPRVLFGEARVAKATADAGVAAGAAELEQRDLIDWPRSARAKMSIFRRLFEDFPSADAMSTAPTAPAALAADFSQFRATGGTLLENHARFEALHAANISADPAAWSWTHWPARWRDPASEEVTRFAQQHSREVSFHCFLQWIADRSLAAAQRAAKESGMRIGLIADLAVGMSRAGSHAWTSQNDILMGLEIGAPPDLFNPAGQNWGLTAFSPRALSSGGFAPFIETLRACLRHAGGLRVDHAMGLLRLWVIPVGAKPTEGAYLAYPLDDLMRLTALESHRHRAIIIGEDLGTLPAGFRARLAQAGVYGMRVLWFERARGRFTPPQHWSAAAAAMTSTHDLPTVAGWWRGTDIEARAARGLAPEAAQEKTARREDRRTLWRAFRRAKAAEGEAPPPTEPPRVIDAAVKFIAQAQSDIALLPLEDALGLEQQPNLPGTIDEHPNWRRRYAGPSGALLDAPEIRRRLAPLARRDAR